eukprot:4802480-Pleurochrysis_carterae.AAC.1
MDDHVNRVLAYFAQNADEGIEYKIQGAAQLIAYSDSDWAVRILPLDFASCTEELRPRTASNVSNASRCRRS